MGTSNKIRIERRAVSVEVLVGTEIPGGGGRGRLYITLHCHHYNDSCIKSYDSHFSVFTNCEGQSRKTMSTDDNFWREWRTEAESNRGSSAYEPNALPLNRTGSFSLLFLLSHHLCRPQRHCSCAARPDISTSDHTQASFRNTAPPPEVHRRRSSGAVWKSRWPSWALVPNKPT